MKKLYLVDVSSMFFRAFYAIPPLTNSKGLPTNALYGFLSMSIKLLREEKPDYMVYCFDRPEPSFRLDLYEEYKANRTELPEDLAPQLPYVRTLTEKLGIHAVDKIKFEADDVIGTLARWGQEQGLEIVIVSGDKDFAQLVNDRVFLYDTMKNVKYTPALVNEKWGVPPEQIIEYLSIVGDTSDNIPGVRGIGPKGAQKLLAKYKSLEDIYEHIEDIEPEGIKNKLIESKKSAFLAKKLVTIDTHVDLNVQLSDVEIDPINKEELKLALDELEFSAFMRKIFPEPGMETFSVKPKSSSAAKTKKFSTKSDIPADAENGESAASQLSSSDQTSSSAQNMDLKNWQRVQLELGDFKKIVQPYDEIWAAENERGMCFGYKNKLIQVNATLDEIGIGLAEHMLRWKGFNLKSIWHRLNLVGEHVPLWDSMLAAYTLKAGDCESFEKVYKLYTGKELPELSGPEEVLFCDLELESVLKKLLIDAEGENILNTYELPLVSVLYNMEKKGILLDVNLLKQQSQSLQQDLQTLEKDIFQMAGESFNLNSPKQLGVVLFEKLKIPSVKKTKTGYSTDNDVLTKLALQYPMCQKIIEYRELNKLKSTYVDAMPALVDAKDGRVHTQFNQAIATTGRLSSTNPNLQNIPIRTERGRLVRKAFVASKDHVLLSVDYSQIELRVLAEITQDPGLIAAFQKNIDVHAATAAEVFDIPQSEVTTEQRRMAKAVNFGIAYGQGVFGLAETLEISRDEAKTIIENYFRKFPKVKDYMFQTVEKAKEDGYVTSLFGRRRYLDEFKSSNQAVRKFGERAAVNAPMQGTASDIVKLAMIKIHESLNAQMILQVHDELLFEVPVDDIEDVSQDIKKIMENAVKMSVPLTVNMAWGPNWDDAHA
jgi:DNA polymerase-1